MIFIHLKKQMEWWLIILLIVLVCILIKLFFNRPISSLTKDLTGYITIVTGSSAGIGKVTAAELLGKGATVILACRNESKTTKVIESFPKKLQSKAIYMNLDLSSLNSVELFANEFNKRFQRLDILVNNAGQMNDSFYLTKDGLEQTIQTNHISVTYLTALLYPILKQSKGKVVTVGSEAHEFATMNELKDYKEAIKTKNYDECKKNYKALGFNQYAFSKLGNNFMTKFFSQYAKLNKDDVSFNCVHPGFVSTEIFRIDKWWKYIFALGFIPVSLLIAKSEFVGAQSTLHVCYLNSPEPAAYYKDCAVKGEAKLALDENKMKSYMKYTFDSIRSLKTLNFNESLLFEIN